MYEIVIKNLKTGEEQKCNETESYLVLCFSEDKDNWVSVGMRGTIDAMSDAMAVDPDVRAACRLAVAKHDAMKDGMEARSKKTVKGIMEMPAEKLAGDEE